MQNRKKEKAITLIALVITIIVLLILAGVTIAMLTGNNGILTKANNAKTLTVEGEEIEQIKLAYNTIKTDKMHKGDKTAVTIGELQVEFETQKIEASIEENSEPIKITFTKTGNQYTLDTEKEEVKKIGSILPPKEKSELVKAKEAQTVFDKETPLKDEWENTVVVPKGFKIAEDSGEDVTQGVVIEDVVKEGARKGSQFVWIPIGTDIKGANGVSEKIELGRYEFEEDGTAKAYTGTYREETVTNTSNITAKDIEAFKTSVGTKGGYYIGRYEVGIENGTLNKNGLYQEIAAPSENWTGWTGNLVCKKERQVWNYITQRKAASLARDMYSDGEGVTSDLMNSYAWDTAVLFIEKFSGDTDYAKRKSTKTDVIATGMTEDVKCNIHDMAENVGEWTTETYVGPSQERCVLRGGIVGKDSYWVDVRNDNGWVSANQLISFRVVLY